MSFAEDIRKFVEKSNKEISKNITDTAQQLFTKVVDYSPSYVGTPQAQFSKGELINNWFPFVNSMSTGIETSFSDTGESSRMRINSIPADSFDKKDGYIALTNNTQWAYRAEYLGWEAPTWSGRVGAYAMVRKAMNEVSTNLKG